MSSNSSKVKKSKNKLVKKITGSLFVVAFSLFPLFLFTGCSPVDSTSIINQIFPNVWVFISHVFAVIVLLVLIIWLVWKPTVKVVDDHKRFIEKEIVDAKEATNEAFKRLEEINEAKILIQSQVKAIVDRAENEGNVVRKRIEREAQIAANQIIKDANADINSRKREMEVELNNKIADVSFYVAQAILGREIRNPDNTRMVNNIIQKVCRMYGAKRKRVVVNSSSKNTKKKSSKK